VLKHSQSVTFPFNVRDHVSHPYKRAGKIMVFNILFCIILMSYILIFMFLRQARVFKIPNLMLSSIPGV
jgi:hypothetical protein